MPKIAALFLLAALSIAGCAGGSSTVVVNERYVTAIDPALNIDSVAAHAAADGGTWLFATAKEGDVVRIYDAATGAFVRDLGTPGAGAGQFDRPNGIAALDGLVFVVERDNRRVQLFGMPALEPLAMFGTAELVKPYGVYVLRRSPERYDVYVTDNYETADERVPPASELGRRVHRFTLTVRRDASGVPVAAAAVHAQQFGETLGPGVLRVVESLWGDPQYDRLLLAEEDPAGGRVLKVYSLAGRFSDQTIGDGFFATQPEGIALYACDGGSGYWITTDQSRRRNVFHVFDRNSLEHAGAFSGTVTRNTDGVWLTREPLPGFPAGAFFAVHDDQAVAAFDWRDIAAALTLNPCPPGSE